MLRGLLIRQGFLGLDLVLALTVLIIAFQAVVRFLGAAPPVNSAEATRGLTPEAVEVREVAPLASYAVISQSGIFGAAARTSADTPPPAPEPEPETIQETRLPLTLLGYAARYPRDPFATAQIENGATRTRSTYYLDQPIVDQVVLHEVYRRYVVLKNLANGQLTTLSMNDADASIMVAAQQPQARPVSMATTRRPEPGSTPSNRIAVPRSELVEVLSQNPAELISTVNPELHYENGRVAGITSQNLSRIPITSKMGLRDGDVVQRVNGVAIDSEERIIEIINRYANSPTFQISVLRDGKPLMLTYNLE